MNRSHARTYHVGEIRPSQILTYYGIGAVVDLPSISTIIMGLDSWQEELCTPIAEERLRTYIQHSLGLPVQALKAPPLPDPNQDVGQYDGVPVNIFPRTMVCPKCRLLAPLKSGLFQLKYAPSRPDATRYVHATCTAGKQPTVLPARFVVACENGHLDDFPWLYFVHRGKTCPDPAPSLRLREIGVTGEAMDVLVAKNAKPRAPWPRHLAKRPK